MSRENFNEKMFLYLAKPRHAYAIEKSSDQFSDSLLGLSKVHFVSPVGNVELTVLKKDQIENFSFISKSYSSRVFVQFMSFYLICINGSNSKSMIM